MKKILEGLAGTVLVVRAKPHGEHREDQFLKGTVSIGWPTSVDFQGKNRNEIEEIITNEGHSSSPLALTQILNFVTTPKKGLILTPSLENPSIIHVLITTDTYKYDPNRINDGNPHTIPTEHLLSIPKSDFPDRIRRSFKAARKAVTDFSKYYKEVVDTINNFITSEESTEEQDNPKADAIAVLRDLLKSDSDEVRLKAALALVEADKNKN